MADIFDNSSTSTPSVITAYADYAPGSVAGITAAGFDPGATIQFMVQIIDPLTGELLQPVTWCVIVGADGTVSTDFSVTSLYAGQTMLLTATEETVEARARSSPRGRRRPRRSRTFFLSRPPSPMRTLTSTSPRW